MIPLAASDQAELPPPPEIATSSSPSPAPAGPAPSPSPSPPPSPRSPKPDRTECKKSSQRTPSGIVWAHRYSDLVEYDDGYWSPSMMKVADENYAYPDEPKPRKLRIWPVLTVAPGVQCNEELLYSKDFGLDEAVEKADNAETVVPKLEQRISKDLLPEILIVEDPENRTRARSGEEDGSLPNIEIKYRRVYPKPTRAPNPDVISRPSARLKIPSIPAIGEGTHANVYHAHLTLEDSFRLVPDSMPHPTTIVRVAAKIAFSGEEDRCMLENEGQIYDAFPDHLSEDWSGYNAVGESVTRYTDGRIPATAVVPKFYGYFIPIQNTMQAFGRPILLMEDCGSPITPATLTRAERAICFAFLHRLFRENFMQHSFHNRNILVQPGPLTQPPEKRSLKNASFRLVDFGRARNLADLLRVAVVEVNHFELQINDGASMSTGGPQAETVQASLEAKAAKNKIYRQWTKSFRSEVSSAKDAVFGKFRTYSAGFDKYCDGILEPAPRTCEREWVFESHEYYSTGWFKEGY